MGKGKAWGLETPLERAEMHAEAFVQVTAWWCFVCGSALLVFRAQHLVPPVFRSAALFTARGRAAVALPRRDPRRALGYVRFVLVSSFR